MEFGILLLRKSNRGVWLGLLFWGFLDRFIFMWSMGIIIFFKICIIVERRNRGFGFFLVEGYGEGWECEER